MLQPPPNPPFRIFESLISGLRYVRGNLKLLALVSVVPFLIGVVCFVLADQLDTVSFMMPVIQFPMFFMVGVLGAAILRFMVLGESPRNMDDAARRARNAFLINAGGVYAAVRFFFEGVQTSLVMLDQWAQGKPEALAPFMPILLAVLVLLLWGMRWLWLSVPVALGWDARGFFEKLGKWGGSLRVLGLYAMCSLLVNVVIAVVWQVLSTGAPEGGMNAGYMFAIHVLMAAGFVTINVLFAVCSGMAVRQMLAGKKVSVDV